MNQEINDKIIELIHRRLQHKSLSREEASELDAWINLSPENSQLYAELTNQQLFDAAVKEFGEPDTEASLQKVKQRIFITEETDHVHMRTTSQIPWRRVMRVAAAIIPFLFLGGYLYVRSTHSVSDEKRPDQTAFTETQKLVPGGDRAYLTLSDGSTINLDSSKIGTLAIQESAIKYGEMLYNIAKANNTAGEVKFNTLSIPRGLKLEVVLPDNSHVWLSALSTLRFPNDFSGNERRIELAGEAQFEIAKDASKPFIVKIISEKGKQEGSEVRVLGTHFNITAYDNENTITTTLLEGSVQVSSHNEKAKLIPGEQAVLAPGKQIEIRKNIDINSYSDRKEGIFKFKNAPVEEIIKQIERMYKVKVIHEGNLPDEFNTTLFQSDSLEELLHDLNQYEKLQWSLKGSTVTVKQQVTSQHSN